MNTPAALPPIDGIRPSYLHLPCDRRLADAPLYFQVTGLPPMSAGQPLLVDLLEWDELDLTVQARAVRLLADPHDSDPVGAEAAPGPDAGSPQPAVDSIDTE